MLLKACLISFSNAPILGSTSFSDVHLFDKRLPRYGKGSTCSRDVSQMVVSKSGKTKFGAGCARTLVNTHIWKWYVFRVPSASTGFIIRLLIYAFASHWRLKQSKFGNELVTSFVFTILIHLHWLILINNEFLKIIKIPICRRF